VPYGEWSPTVASYASRTMLVSGLIVFVFIVYHLLHFTAQVKYINLTGQSFVHFEDPQKRHDIFKMMVVGFNDWRVSGFYVLGMALLAMHLSHGVGAMFQSLGLKNKTYGPVLDKASFVIGWLIFIGYSSIPTAILLGFGKEALK
jgi:succinate dehydrogenase / fumarate reductase cytochrome b subunit